MNNAGANNPISRRDFIKASSTIAAAGAFLPWLPGAGLETLPEPVEVAATQAAVRAAIPTASNVKFEKLFSPCKIGKLTLKNRIVKSAAGLSAGTTSVIDPKTNSYASDTLAFYEALAKGGVGLFIVDNPAWIQAPRGRPFWDDQYIPAEKQIVDTIHKFNVPAFLQFYSMANFSGNPVMAASPVYFPSKLDMNNALPKEMTLDDIHQFQNTLVAAAVRAQKAGYDGVEINAGCSHLFSSFLSRFLNKRKDQYGPQSIPNQARILTEMIQTIKQKCGADFAISVLINGYEVNVLEIGNDAYCTKADESAAIAQELEKAGADLIHVRSGTFGDHPRGFFPDLFYLTGEADNGYGHKIDLAKAWPEFVTQYGGSAAFVETAAKVKQAVKIPVMTVGAMDPRLLPEYIESTVAQNKIDLVAMTRPLLADPELPNKLAAGKIQNVRPCTHCYTCFRAGGGSGYCRVNAAFARAAGKDMPEGYDVQRAPSKKTVMVIGGGPAGMEAARVAALRGHQVTLYDRSNSLGGLLPTIATLKGQHEKIMDFVTYLSTQLTELGVTVKLGQAVDEALVTQEKPDVVIVANGASYTAPNIPGINLAKASTFVPAENDVVVLGGQLQGVEVAERLVHRGKHVTVLEEGPEENLGKGLPGTSRQRLLYFLQTHGVDLLADVKIDKITAEGVSITLQNGLSSTIKATGVVLARPGTANPNLADRLKDKAKQVLAVGDCNTPGVIETCVASANLAARKI